MKLFKKTKPKLHMNLGSGLVGFSWKELIRLEEDRAAEERRLANPMLFSGDLERDTDEPAANDVLPAYADTQPLPILDLRQLIALAFGQDSVDDQAFNRISHFEELATSPHLVIAAPGGAHQMMLATRSDGAPYVMGKSNISAETALARVHAALTCESMRTFGVQFKGPAKDQALMWLAAQDEGLPLLNGQAPVIDPAVMKEAKREWAAFKTQEAIRKASRMTLAPQSGMRQPRSSLIAEPAITLIDPTSFGEGHPSVTTETNPSVPLNVNSALDLDLTESFEGHAAPAAQDIPVLKMGGAPMLNIDLPPELLTFPGQAFLSAVAFPAGTQVRLEGSLQERAFLYLAAQDRHLEIEPSTKFSLLDQWEIEEKFPDTMKDWEAFLAWKKGDSAPVSQIDSAAQFSSPEQTEVTADADIHRPENNRLTPGNPVIRKYSTPAVNFG